MKWQQIDTIPDNNKSVLVCFKGHHKWIYFIVIALGNLTRYDGYAKPEFWCDIEEPK